MATKIKMMTENSQNDIYLKLCPAQTNPNTPEDACERLDVILANAHPDWPRAQIKKSIENGLVSINGNACTKPGKKINLHHTITYPKPDIQTQTQNPTPETNIPLNIIFEDEHIIIINKQPGLVVHPGAGHTDGTLVNALLAKYPEIANIGAPDRPGIVHRLDADTSGLLMIAKSQAAYEKLVPMFAEHQVSRQYIAICATQSLQNTGTFDTPYGRHPKNRVKYSSKFPAEKRAVTHYRVITRNTFGFALVACKLETGRTHQIRVHMSENHAPILADPLYAPAKFAKSKHIERLALHAQKLRFQHPITQQPMAFDAIPPADFLNALQSLHLEWKTP